MSTILVTGGAGFIGSHTCVELLESGYDVVVIDNLSNACEESLKRVEKITGKTLKFYKGDIADKELMDKILTENDIYAVIHFAGLKAVGESVQKPLEYYTNNISGTLAMCDVMRKHGVKNIIFTDIETDGALSGPSFARLEALKQVYTGNIVASGGVSSNEDIRRLARMGLYGAIVGKAYYAGTVDLAQAVRDAGRQD